ncbi:hypothetical protein WJX73_004858 [Symbiochloris irregularis]|uniref:Beta-carotene isomerase D27-like C-terminal domain-containing protein n=1 Tax=Symbiochloris irregularis TaxID=706552 RepID=A0AAW1NPZ6_9CHLO
MVAALGQDVTSKGYQSIVDLTRILNATFDRPEGTQQLTRQILVSLFPRWLLPAFRALFSAPMPQLSCRLNAFVTALTCQWLMGKCTVNDAEDSNGNVLPGQGVHVERCRYLEETQCASVCINSCKLPTQSFFAKDMGLPLLMEPNYDDFSCQFSFGRQPPEVDEALSTPCFLQCPTKRPHRSDAGLCQGCDTSAAG